MELEKVIYQFGNNKVFDYFILDRKEHAIEKDIDKNSLAYHFDGKEKIKVSNYGQIIFERLTYYLKKEKKELKHFAGIL